MGCLLKLLSPVISVFVTLAVVGVVGYVLLNSALRPHDTVITVTSDTTKSCHGDPAQNDCTFLVRTNDGTFEDFEAKVLLRGTSGTVSRQLPKGHSYSVSVFGTSVPLFTLIERSAQPELLLALVRFGLCGPTDERQSAKRTINLPSNKFRHIINRR